MARLTLTIDGDAQEGMGFLREALIWRVSHEQRSSHHQRGAIRRRQSS
jgi:hypothetical protein